MFNFNPDIMQLDDGATGAPRVTGPGNAPVTEEELAKILEEENKKYDPVTGMPLDLLASDIPEIRNLLLRQVLHLVHILKSLRNSLVQQILICLDTRLLLMLTEASN